MHYPFGEHIAFIDAQPLLSFIFNKLLNGNELYAANIIAVVNLLMLASVPVAAVYLYRIFNLWKLPNYYAAIAAACIALLSPQVFRMTGHYALAYACFFPMLWYYTASWLEERRISSAIGILLTLLFFGSLHAYYFALGASFLLPLSALFFLFKGRDRKTLLKGLVPALAAILPMLLYQFWLSWTGAGELTDRHPRPFGFFYYTANLRSIFLPHQGLLYEWLTSVFTFKLQSFEGIAYIGSASLIAWLGGIVTMIRFRENRSRFPAYFFLYLLVAVICLLVSQGLPFKMIPGAWIPEPVWQFRALGRFAWVFYYVFAASAVWMLYLWAESLRTRGQSVVAMAVVVISLVLWASEGLSAHKSTATYVNENGRIAADFLSVERSYSSVLQATKYRPSDFQAIIAFPYFGVGSEESYIERGGAGLYQACKASLELRLPIAETFLGRTSVSQAQQLIQMMSHPTIPKEILNHFPYSRPLLLILAEETEYADEQYLLSKAEYLGATGDVKLYVLPLQALQREVPMAEITAVESLRGRQTIIRGGDTIIYSNADFYYGMSVVACVGSRRSLCILTDTLAEVFKGEAYEVSMWLETQLKSAAYPVLYVRQYAADGSLLTEDFCNPKTVTDVYQNHVRAAVRFVPAPLASRVVVTLEGKEKKGHSFMIKGAAPILVKSANGSIWWNNYPVAP